ncbi:AAA family ATPase [Streptomyces kaniharaensis]|uniref:AAA family ATPase n=1 Tax=Streptomyces kaniharaensis TaxID=212423 RepID=A0A6N7L1W3_9ACTN|nr:AAA family ATPase [Streptomyces kaniharaensis]MQS17591.1 AAA family ATPase [Streptomyces kaniharaensis]
MDPTTARATTQPSDEGQPDNHPDIPDHFAVSDATARTLAELDLPNPCLLVLIGVPGAGKSALAEAFGPDDVLSSDQLRGLATGDRADQSVSTLVWEVLLTLLGSRLALRRSAVIDATNAEQQFRQPLLALAEQHRVPAVALVVDTSLDVALARNSARPPGLRVPDDFIRDQYAQILADLPGLQGEGFADVLHTHRLPLIASLLRRQREREEQHAGVEAEARVLFGEPVARLFTWDPPLHNGSIYGTFPGPGGAVTISYTPGASPWGGFEAETVCPHCAASTWTTVSNAAGLQAVTDSAATAERSCWRCTAL